MLFEFQEKMNLSKLTFSHTFILTLKLPGFELLDKKHSI